MSLRLLVLLLLASCTGSAFASDRTEVYEGHSGGELTIDGEGRVVAVALDNDALGDEIVAAFEQRIREWRFEPILEDGKPVVARARMRLKLLAMREPGSTEMRLGFENVHFVDFGEQAPVAASGTRMTPPRYPVEPLRAGVGASVSLVLRLDADGVPTHVAVSAINLLGEKVGSPAQQKRHADLIARAAENAARGFRMPAQAGELVTVPMGFHIGSSGARRWIRSRAVAVDPPSWVTIEEVARSAERLGEAGEASTSRLRLLTAIDG